MMASDAKNVTSLLQRHRAGDKRASEELLSSVYPELHRIAASYMRKEREDHTLQPTALLNEAYMKVFSGESVDWNNRVHFYAVMAQQMRRILVDHARSRNAEKRGSGAVKVAIENLHNLGTSSDEDLIVLDEAMKKLEAVDERAAKVVELRFFGGLTEPETAEALGISVATMKRDWVFARSFLFNLLKSQQE